MGRGHLKWIRHAFQIWRRMITLFLALFMLTVFDNAQRRHANCTGDSHGAYCTADDCFYWYRRISGIVRVKEMNQRTERYGRA